MICVIATIEVAAGRRDELLAIFQTVAPKVRAEPGCIEYGAMIDVRSGLAAQGPMRNNGLTIVEKWESLEALHAHLKTLHMADYFRMTEALQPSLTLQVMQPV